MTEEDKAAAEELRTAEVMIIIGRTDVTSEHTEAKVRLLEGKNEGHIITRNVNEPVSIQDVLTIRQTGREQRK